MGREDEAVRRLVLGAKTNVLLTQILTSFPNAPPRHPKMDNSLRTSYLLKENHEGFIALRSERLMGPRAPLENLLPPQVLRSHSFQATRVILPRR